MNYSSVGSHILVSQYDSFSITETLECGQCFRYFKVGDNSYGLIAKGRLLVVEQAKDGILFHNTTKDEFETIWMEYFDLARDYGQIKRELRRDRVLKEAISFAPGIRVLQQDFFECLISFIISQNSRIPRIKENIKTIARRYGTYLGAVGQEECYAFPTAKVLAEVSEDALYDCKVGFRAKYIADAARKCADGTISRKRLQELSSEDARKALQNIKGVGQKVADCVLLFSLNRGGVFPTDVWVKRIMSALYFNGEETPLSVIQEKAHKLYGEYAGFAQQYLFHYARTLKIGAKDQVGGQKTC